MEGMKVADTESSEIRKDGCRFRAFWGLVKWSGISQDFCPSAWSTNEQVRQYKKGQVPYCVRSFKEFGRRAVLAYCAASRAVEAGFCFPCSLRRRIISLCFIILWSVQTVSPISGEYWTQQGFSLPLSRERGLTFLSEHLGIHFTTQDGMQNSLRANQRCTESRNDHWCLHHGQMEILSDENGWGICIVAIKPNANPINYRGSGWPNLCTKRLKPEGQKVKHDCLRAANDWALAWWWTNNWQSRFADSIFCLTVISATA